MKIAKRLKSFKAKTTGPHTPLLFQDSYEPFDGFDTVVVGKGKTRKEAADNAIELLGQNNMRPILLEIKRQLYATLPPNKNAPEADQGTYMYCIVGVNVER